MTIAPEPVVRIVPRLDLYQHATVTDILVEYDGRHYGSRTNVLLEENRGRACTRRCGLGK